MGCGNYRHCQVEEEMSLELLLHAAKFLEQQEESCKGKSGCGRGVILQGVDISRANTGSVANV